MNMLFLLERLVGEREQTALAKESGVVLVLDDRFFVRLWFKICEEFVIAVNSSQRR